MAWYTNGKHTNQPPPPVPRYQALMGQARAQEEFAFLLEDMDAPAWRVKYEMDLAGQLWQAASEAKRQFDLVGRAWESEPQAQLRLRL